MGAMTKLSGATHITPINTSCKTLLTKEAIAISKMAFSQNVEEVESQWWGFRQPLHRTISEDKTAPVHSLPDDVLQLIFSRLPRRSLAVTRLVCSPWKRVCEHQDMAVLRQQVQFRYFFLNLSLTHKHTPAHIQATDRSLECSLYVVVCPNGHRALA